MAWYFILCIQGLAISIGLRFTYIGPYRSLSSGYVLVYITDPKTMKYEPPGKVMLGGLVLLMLKFKRLASS